MLGISPALSPRSVALILGARTFPRLGLRRGVERYVREHHPSWRLIQKINHTHLDWPDAMSRPADGLLLFLEEPAQAEWVKAQAVPTINMHRVPGCDGLNEVLVDDPEVGRSAARYFLSKGFRRFAYCTHVPHKGFSQDRHLSFTRELRQAGFEAAYLSTAAGDPSIEAPLLKLLQDTGEQRLAVFCCDDACGGILSTHCRNLGLRIPGDLAVLGAGDDAFHVENDTVTLSSVKIDFAAVGYHAAATLDALLSGKSVPAQQRIATSGVTERASTSHDLESPAVRRLLRFIEELHTDPDFTPEMASTLCKVSSRTLRRYLKEAERPSFSDLLRNRRLETAARQLLDTEDPVERISETSGFIDYTTFFRAFRRSYGMSPSDYRKQLTSHQ